MESIRKAVALIFVMAVVSSSSGLEIGGSISYSVLAGDFGKDHNGGVGFSAVLRNRFSTTEDLSLVASANRFAGRDNQELTAWLRLVSLRFRFFPVEEKPYFLRYSVSFFNLQRSLGGRTEQGSYPALGLGGGVVIAVSREVQLTLGLELCRVLAEARSGSVVSIDAQFARHF